MLNRLDEKIIVVTGGTQGIGEACATLAVERGAAGVVICGRNAENGARVEAKLRDMGADALYVRADLMEVAQCRKVMRAAGDRFGRIHALVNAAALTSRGYIEDTTPELFDQMFALNTRAPFFLIQDAVNMMQASGEGGSIVNILSISGNGGQPFIAPYVASKGALAILTKNVAHSQRKHRIRVNGINMGWTATENEHKVQLSEGQPENWLEIADANASMGRILRPRDIAGLACYLMSDEASLMTGTVIDFDQRVIGAFD